jgi:hypothetical protein
MASTFDAMTFDQQLDGKKRLGTGMYTPRQTTAYSGFPGLPALKDIGSRNS